MARTLLSSSMSPEACWEGEAGHGPWGSCGRCHFMPSLPQNTSQGSQLADPTVPEEGRMYPDLSSPGHLLVEGKTYCSPFTSHKDSETARGKRTAVPTFWCKSSLTSEVSP